MAIQLPNPGLGDGQTGDNEFVMWTKVKDNFSDTTHAASKLVGVGIGKLVVADKINEAANEWTRNYDRTATVGGEIGFSNAPVGYSFLYGANLAPDAPPGMGGYAVILKTRLYGSIGADAGYYQFWVFNYLPVPGTTTRVWTMFKSGSDISATSVWVELYTTGIVTKDSNGFLKGSSPIVKVHADKVVLNREAEHQGVTFTKNGVGDYTITTKSGLSTDGWHLELPKDLNGNPKVAVTLEEVDGVISLKTYKRIFSMETFTFVPDLDNPLDIPDTRWIDLRLNEIPVEIEDDIQTEV